MVIITVVAVIYRVSCVQGTSLPKVGHPKCNGQDLSQTSLIPRLKSRSSVWASPKLSRELGLCLHVEAGNLSLSLDEHPGALGLQSHDFVKSHSQRSPGLQLEAPICVMRGGREGFQTPPCSQLLPHTSSEVTSVQPEVVESTFVHLALSARGVSTSAWPWEGDPRWNHIVPGLFLSS